MSAPGWYPDPGGQKGMFRYWDGQSWSPTVSPTPQAERPSAGGGFDPSRPLGQSAGTGSPGGPAPRTPTPGTTRNRAWWIAGIAAACVVVLLIALGVRQLAGSFSGLPGGGSTPGGSKRETCPRQTTTPTPGPPGGTRDGRVYGGRLSYPLLPAPWSTPSPDGRVPFGSDVRSQVVTTETNRNPQYDWSGWVASVLVARLQAGDGFYTPQQGSEIVVTCIVGSFYGNAKVNRDDTTNKAVQVQGKEAWLVESHLTFDIKGLQTKGELLIVLIVATNEGEASLFYASIPDNARQWEAPARQAMAGLRVEG